MTAQSDCTEFVITELQETVKDWQGEVNVLVQAVLFVDIGLNKIKTDRIKLTAYGKSR